MTGPHGVVRLECWGVGGCPPSWPHGPVALRKPMPPGHYRKAKAVSRPLRAGQLGAPGPIGSPHTQIGKILAFAARNVWRRVSRTQMNALPKPYNLSWPHLELPVTHVGGASHAAASPVIPAPAGDGL